MSRRTADSAPFSDLPADAVGPVAGLLAMAATLLLLIAPASAIPVAAQESDAADRSAAEGPVQPHPEAEDAISRLKSPFCPGLMLEVCPSPQASELRDTLRVMAEQGADSDSLVSWMLARYGEEYRAVPQARGGGLLAWVVPPLVLLLGAGLVVLALRRLRADDGDRIDREDVGEISPEDERRLSEALREMEREGR